MPELLLKIFRFTLNTLAKPIVLAIFEIQKMAPLLLPRGVEV